MIQQLKEKIEKFRISRRGFSAEYNPDLNFYGIKSEALKYASKKDYRNVCLLISTWLIEKSQTFSMYQLTDIIVLGNDVYLYTKRPGIWIGKAGSTLESLEHRMNHTIYGEKIHDYKIHIIEDQDSIFNMISTSHY